MARIARVDIRRVRLSAAWRIQILQDGGAPTVNSCAADRRERRRRAGANPCRSKPGPTRRSRASRPPCVIISRRPSSAPIRATSPTCTREWSATIRPSFSVGQPLCKAGIDLACYDLWGKQTAKSGQRPSSAARRKQSEAELDDTVADDRRRRKCNCAQGKAFGYDNFNIKIGYPQTPAYDLELVRAVMAFAPNGFHWADANTNYDLDTAVAMAPKLADLGLKGLNRRCRPTASAPIKR